MPIYEYFCSKYRQSFELMRPMNESNDPALCPVCNNPSEKLASVFASTADSSIKVPAKGPFREK